jgi:hypothetical protein
MDDALAKRGHSLEEAFFAQRNAQLIEQRRRLDELEKNKEELAKISGIKNPKVLEKLLELGITPTVLASLSLVPLVEVAWADGELDIKERKAVLDAAAKGGFSEGSVDFKILGEWLKEKPSPKFLEAWMQYIEGLRESLTQAELDDLKVQLLSRARQVAEAAGGFMGIGSKISEQEQAVLKKMEAAFKR